MWPYLEQFTVDAGSEIRAELGGKPDLIIGALLGSIYAASTYAA